MNERGGVSSGAADGAAAGGSERAPLLRAGAGGYAAWKPTMNVFLQRHGAAGVHTEELSEEQWLEDSSDVAAWAKQALTAARAAARGGSSTTKDEAKQEEALSAEALSGRATVKANVERSHKAFGALYSALSEDLRMQVAHLPQGWAHGLWMWLERKFQSTEPESVGILLKRWVSLEQTEDESFDAYRARVNEVHALLKHAKQEQTPEMYCLFLLDRLQPRYTSVVLALKNGSMLKDMANVDWDAVTMMVNSHERRESAETSGAKAMAARAAPETYSSAAARAHSPAPEQRNGGNGGDRDHGSGSRSRSLQEVQCYNCGKYGHISRNCQKPRMAGGNRGGQGYGGRRDEQASSLSSNDWNARGEFALSLKTKRGKGQVPKPDEQGWIRVDGKSSASISRKMKSKEIPQAAKMPDVDAGEWRRGATPVSSAIPV